MHGTTERPPAFPMVSSTAEVVFHFFAFRAIFFSYVVKSVFFLWSFSCVCDFCCSLAKSMTVTRCDLDRVHHSNMTTKRFAREYENIKPVIIEGLVGEKWPALSAGRWARPSLMDSFGLSPIHVRFVALLHYRVILRQQGVLRSSYGGREHGVVGDRKHTGICSPTTPGHVGTAQIGEVHLETTQPFQGSARGTSHCRYLG